MHELTVRVTTLDAKGKMRKLEVSSRRGYYLPKSDSDHAANKWRRPDQISRMELR